LPAALAGTEPVTGVLKALEDAGALDFRELNDTDVATWLAAVQQWPSGMPPTTDPAKHHLTDSEVDRERSAADRARQERARRRRIVIFADREFDVEAGDYSALVGQLQSLGDLGPDFVQGRRPRFAAPYPPSAVRTRSGFYAGTGGNDAGMSPSQRDAIGFIGEWFAFQWLLAHHRGADSSSWVSTNRRHVFPGPGGNDGLGFDFSIGSGNSPLMYEVKATQGGGGLIELGESEVRAAQRFAGSERWRILTVTSVLDSANRAVVMLPNPFSAQGRERYRQDGGAFRFTYRL
jgi:hypothetical protein